MIGRWPPSSHPASFELAASQAAAVNGNSRNGAGTGGATRAVASTNGATKAADPAVAAAARARRKAAKLV